MVCISVIPCLSISLAENDKITSMFVLFSRLFQGKISYMGTLAHMIIPKLSLIKSGRTYVCHILWTFLGGLSPK